jgi:hypothetical protein
MYFRLDENRFFVPVSLIVPGSQIPFVKGGDKDKATLDIIGTVIDEAKRPIGQARETVKLNLDPSLQARQKNIQYTTSFNLPPGKYTSNLSSAKIRPARWVRSRPRLRCRR